MSLDVFAQLALLPEYPAADVARVLVADEDVVDGVHVARLVLGHRAAQVAHKRLQRHLVLLRSS